MRLFVYSGRWYGFDKSVKKLRRRNQKDNFSQPKRNLNEEKINFYHFLYLSRGGIFILLVVVLPCVGLLVPIYPDAKRIRSTDLFLLESKTIRININLNRQNLSRLIGISRCICKTWRYPLQLILVFIWVFPQQTQQHISPFFSLKIEISEIMGSESGGFV